MSAEQLELIAKCPFCQSESELKSAPNDYAAHGGEMGVPNTDAFFVHCDGCGADGPVGDSEGEARDFWNKRSATWGIDPETLYEQLTKYADKDCKGCDGRGVFYGNVAVCGCVICKLDDYRPDDADEESAHGGTVHRETR